MKLQNPAENPEIRDIDSLIPYANNSRTHSDEQVAQIAASIKEWGFTNPVLIDSDGSVIAGHGRLLAARRLGIKKIPVVIVDGWTDAQKKAYVIADNKLALNAGWDDDLLRLEFDGLTDLGFDLELTGFTMDEINKLSDFEEEVTAPKEAQYSSVFEVVVQCNDEDEQESVYNMLTSRGMKCRVLSM